DLVLSLGVIDGRNVWRADLEAILDQIEPVVKARGADKVIVSASCSFLHVPIDLDQEQKLDAEVRTWLAFALQKIDELSILGRALDGGRASVEKELKAWSDAAKARKTSDKTHNKAVQERLKSVTARDSQRVP